MTEEEITILIESYLDGELSEEEKLQFEQNIKEDKELANDLMIHKAIRSVISDEDLIDLREKLNIIRAEYHKKEALKKRRKKILAYASITIIIIFAISFYFISNKTYTNDQLYAMYYEHYDAGTVVRGEAQPTKEIYTNALRTYDKGQYAEAISLFEQISDTSVFYSPKEFFTGLSYMELKNYTEAIKHLEKAQNDNHNIYHESIMWYCGLCYLKTNQTEKSKQKFQSLNNSCQFYQKKSEEILKNFQ